MPLRHICTSITLRKAITPCFPQCNYAPHACLHHICTSISWRKAITPRFPQCNHARNKFKEKPCLPRSTPPRPRRTRAETAPHPHRTQRLTPLDFTTPCTQLYCESTGIRTLPYFQTCTLSHACHANCHLFTEPPHDWASQLWATSCLLLSTTWLSYSILHCLLITLPLDCASQLWATSGLLYRHGLS